MQPTIPEEGDGGPIMQKRPQLQPNDYRGGPGGAAQGPGAAYPGGKSGRASLPREIVLPEDPGKITLIKEIGTGAQAVVYKARWHKTWIPEDTPGNRYDSVIHVAVKELNPSPNQRVTEGESMLFRLRHPNLVRCFVRLLSSETNCFISEFCEGGALYDCLYDQRVRLTWAQRLETLVGVAKGMQYLHAQNPPILHRDLKSSNVLLAKPLVDESSVPFAKVADFGLARNMNVSGAQSQMMTKCVGTWRWMAPEVFNSSAYTMAIDVYSFAILMFEVFARQVPYADRWAVTAHVDPRVGVHIIRGLRPNIKLLDDSCPPNAVALMEGCWARESADRPSFSQALATLEPDAMALRGDTQAKLAFAAKLAALGPPRAAHW
eukprot:TRINITY_DN25633_c0_g1_i4.p1 TRINITY_DN25633_c0_g1~~TRINITY_DN25633_c0_g1_i4.p1  ORF type:complete len:377 (+),score=72.75 TRINITY_DN25633_c0_g1_i4:131-1261(+)